MRTEVSFYRTILGLGIFAAIAALCVGCTADRRQSMMPTTDQNTAAENQQEPIMNSQANRSSSPTELATFGCGCFWCVEAVFQQLDGVEKVESGYSGGHVVNPSYDQVCEKTTGHAEVCQLTYDPKKITFDELLEVFWKTHDPTTPNQQGYDIGPQYRSAVFYHSDQQRAAAENYKKKLNEAGAFFNPIVTEITPYKNFYKAEDHHQNYYLENSNDRYCRIVIEPKLEKFRQVFSAKLKK